MHWRRGEEKRGGLEGVGEEQRRSGEVEGGWMGAGHGFQHIWEKWGGQRQPRSQERERAKIWEKEDGSETE